MICFGEVWQGIFFSRFYFSLVTTIGDMRETMDAKMRNMFTTEWDEPMNSLSGYEWIKKTVYNEPASEEGGKVVAQIWNYFISDQMTDWVSISI